MACLGIASPSSSSHLTLPTISNSSSSSTLKQLTSSQSFPAFPFTPLFPPSSSSFNSTNKPKLIQRRGRKAFTVTVRASHTATASDTDTYTESTTWKVGSPKTLYDVLGVSQSATDMEIKAAYRQLARRYHPDVVPLQQRAASTKKFLQIHAAYATVSDPQSRARYNLQLSIQNFHVTGYGSPGVPSSDVKFKPSPLRTYPTSTYCSPRTPSSSTYGRGRSWETDQCW